MEKRRRWGWDGLLNYLSYRGQSGQWAQLLHRLTGLAIAAFLILHVLDTSLVAFGPAVYDGFTQIYHNPIVRFLEVVLVGVVVYHAINGLRVVLVDFSDRAVLKHKELFWAVVVVFLVLTIPAGVMMMVNFFQYAH